MPETNRQQEHYIQWSTSLFNQELEYYIKALDQLNKMHAKTLANKVRINLKKRRSRKCDTTPNFKSIEIDCEFLSKSFNVCVGDVTKRLNTTQELLKPSSAKIVICPSMYSIHRYFEKGYKSFKTRDEQIPAHSLL